MASLALWSECAAAAKEAPGAPPADAATEPGVDAKLPPPVDAMVDLCPGPITCQTGTMLGTISGDNGSQMLMTSGYQSAWIRVRVTEDVFGGIPLSLSATVTPPPGLDFDVFLYMNEGQDVVECTTRVGTTTTNGTAKTTRALWGDVSGGNGVDDDRTVSIEIRPVSGACAPDKQWQLKIVGNT